MPEDRRRALRQADLDPLTLAATLARIERDPDGLRRVEAGQSVDDDRPDPMRRPVIAEIDRHQPGEGLRDGIGAGQIDIRALLAKAADRDIEKPRIARPQLVVTKAEPSGDARAETFDDDIGAGRQRQRDLACRRSLQVECEAALAAVVMGRHGGVVAVPHPQPARPVPGERLELDDLRPVHREQHRAIGRGDALTQVQHTQPGIGAMGVHFRPHFALTNVCYTISPR